MTDMTDLLDMDLETYALPQELQEQLQSPALVVYLDRVRANVARVIDALGADPDRWRPHVKTLKVPAAMAELVRAGLRAFKCATTREAACLLEVIEHSGAEGDVLLAHPLFGPGLARLGAIADAHPQSRVSVICEDPGAVTSIPDRVGVFVDVNPGMDRTGVPSGDLETIAAIALGAGERFRGVHFYEGHLADLDRAERRRRAFVCYDRLAAILADLARRGVVVGEVITSGTPTFLDARAYEPLRDLPGHRVSPGTVILHDLRSEQELPELGLQPAAVVFARIVSRPVPGVVTADCGSKSMAAEAGDPCASALGHPELIALSPSEEHLPFHVTSGPGPPRGTALLLVPRHVCPTVNLAEDAALIDDGAFVGFEPVAARAHERL